MPVVSWNLATFVGGEALGMDNITFTHSQTIMHRSLHLEWKNTCLSDCWKFIARYRRSYFEKTDRFISRYRKTSLESFFDCDTRRFSWEKTFRLSSSPDIRHLFFFGRLVLKKNPVFSALASKLNTGLINKGLIWYAFRLWGLVYSWRFER